MSQLRKMQKKKIKPLVKELTKLAEKYKANVSLATREIRKNWLEIKGFILKRLATNTLWVLRKTFKFSRRKFDEFNAGLMEMSEICKADKTIDTWGFLITLADECKFKYEERQQIELDLAKILEQENAKELVSYQNIYDSIATNQAIPINTKWETMMLWVLHVYMGFGKVRLARFQEEMKKLWSIGNTTATEMLGTVQKEVGLDRLGTGRVYLQAA